MASPRKLLIQMSGAPGAGKSTVANCLGPSINAVVLDHDVLRSFLLDTGHDFGHAAKLAYDLQWRLIADFLRQGRNVVVDSTCNYQETLDQGASLAERHGYEYYYVECQVKDIGLIEQRLSGREPQRSQRTGIHVAPADAPVPAGNQTDALARFLQWIEHPVRPVSNFIVVDSSRDTVLCLGEILTFMGVSTDECS